MSVLQSDNLLQAIVNHVTLPPRLPSKGDEDGGPLDKALATQVAQEARAFRELSGQYDKWSVVCQSLDQFCILHNSNYLVKGELVRAFSDVAASRQSHLILHIATQNAGLLIRKDKDEVIVEAFEASAPNAAVLAAENALQWDFPSSAVTLPLTVFEDSSFQQETADFLVKCSLENVKHFAATTAKAGSSAFESRDKPNPALIGQLLMAIMEACGTSHTLHVTRKRVRDDVCWDDGAKDPWRRSAAWLVIRVGVQRSLAMLFGDIAGLIHYKFFVAYFLARVCDKLTATGAVKTDYLAHVRTKLARRLYKLQCQQDAGSVIQRQTVSALFIILNRKFEATLYAANTRISSEWTRIRMRSKKLIPRLSRHADEASLVLSLNLSRSRLLSISQSAMLRHTLLQRKPYDFSEHQKQHSDASEKTGSARYDAQFYQDLAKFESEVEMRQQDLFPLDPTATKMQTLSLLASKIAGYITDALPAYTKSPEQLSIMLLTVMELWISLDTVATQVYPLLLQYRPDIPVDCLHVIHLSRLSDLSRLQAVEAYLNERDSSADPALPSLFGHATSQCFAVRYFDQDPKMQQLMEDILFNAKEARASKEAEWRQKSANYEDLLKKAAETSCLYFKAIDHDGMVYSRHDYRNCMKHRLELEANKMRMKIYEDPLPEAAAMAKSVIFELLCPSGLALWRDTTWEIIHTLGHESVPSDQPPKLFLHEYSQLQHLHPAASRRLQLASRTKSFLDTHYAMVSFPVAFEKVCLPNGLRLSLYDRQTQIWTPKQTVRPSLAGLCTGTLPLGAESSSLNRLFQAMAKGNRRVSPNEIIVSQTDCPNTMTVFEFLAFQDLMYGNKLRWVHLLRELASPTLNFGTVSVGSLVTQIALCVGEPGQQGPLRAAQWVFTDAEFCATLGHEIKRRLKTISTNWRENHTLACLTTMIIQLWRLGCSAALRNEAAILLLRVRSTALNWIRLLRQEILVAANTRSAQLRSRDVLVVAFICRWTYVLEQDQDSETIDDLACFMEASIVMRDNMPEQSPGWISRLPISLKTMYLRDLKIVFAIEQKLRRSVLCCKGAIDEAMNRVWPEPSDTPVRTFTEWRFMPDHDSNWISAFSVATGDVKAQAIDFNIRDGLLLINGEQLGRLPKDYTQDAFLIRLLGDRLYRTYPSGMSGMQCMLAAPINGNQVHLGFKDKVPFMRARRENQLFELVRPEIFYEPLSKDADLPMTLIRNHIHWLNLYTGLLHITPIESMWRSKRSNWIIDVHNRRCFRRESFLVDVRSSDFEKIAGIIEPFEYRSEMIVYQPPRNSLTVHLPKLEGMQFEVNAVGLLQSSPEPRRQLKAVIDDNQDAGTLYGLDSKLVLRDIKNAGDRSIAVTTGAMELQAQFGHVRIRTTHTENYIRYSINTTLGRLECPPEPLAIFTKALCHALTSFVKPDPLTGKTGTDEALDVLASGMAQPWTLPNPALYPLLLRIADLTPKRIFYPADLKALQKVIWADTLSFSSQHDQFWGSVMHILRQCKELHRFTFAVVEEPPNMTKGNEDFLLQRARVRNQTQRAGLGKSHCQGFDAIYVSRDQERSVGRGFSLEAAHLARTRPSKLAVTSALADMMQSWPFIQGYQDSETFQPHLLTELIRVDPPAHWGALFRHCQKLYKADNVYSTMFFFGTVCFRADVDMVIIRTLIAFAVLEPFQALSGPQWDCFLGFRKGQLPLIENLVQMMSTAVEPYPPDERSILGGLLNAKLSRKLELAQSKYDQLNLDACRRLASGLLDQWPCRAPSLPSGIYGNIDVERALSLVQDDWLHLFKNYELDRHLQDVQRILNGCLSHHGYAFVEDFALERVLLPRFSKKGENPCLQDIIQTAAGAKHELQDSSLECKLPSMNWTHDILEDPGPRTDDSRVLDEELRQRKQHTESRHEILQLQKLVEPFYASDNPVRHLYGKHLTQSLNALQALEAKTTLEDIRVDQRRLSNAIASSRVAVETQYNAIQKALNHTKSSKWLTLGDLWPNITPITILEILGSSTSSCRKNPLWQAVAVYAELITVSQRLMRIDQTLRYGTYGQLQAEVENRGHVGWSPKDYPDWLLLEIEGNILIREEQYNVAMAMMNPKSEKNSVLQMNMGQGKSSVIIPMVAALLANRSQLMRVIVPKPLLVQVAQLFQSRLGGLINRMIKHIPWSRRSSTKLENVRAYQEIHQQMLRSQGIILALPEHMLSFRLSGLQCLSSGSLDEARIMMETQSWLTSKFRDVLDECDHTLAVKTQLVYPSGSQSMVDGHPNRWKVVQSLLRLVRDRVRLLQRSYPRGIEVIERDKSGTFPVIHFSKESLKNVLIENVTKSVLSGEGDLLPVKECNDSALACVALFISQPHISKEQMPDVNLIFKGKHSARQNLLLLRGLLVHRILLMALTKRWNVQYGLHPQRDPVAVPFQAKGVPSEQAEFGHPDVSILLTCLSFYHTGLTVEQLKQVLRSVLMSDDPALSYDQWVQDADPLPESLRTWNAINIDDEIQCNELWSHLHYITSVIDTFLNTFVFPYHAKTFARKLVSSAWDVPLPPKLHTKSNSSGSLQGSGLTTGFSGTNDNRTLLPLHIKQQDLPGLAHTNAEVLTYLLQSRNRRYVLAADSCGRRLSEDKLLKSICESGIRMLLDAGAQILEYDNFRLVQTWLQIDTEAEAAVYFGTDGRAWVLHRDGSKQPLIASPYQDNLSAAVVYLDEAHTRGTDLRMPATAVAALTLGPGQTKDHTVQAAMRLRRLATLQSVVFYAPPEVHQSILNVTKGGRDDAHVTSYEVVQWLLEQTCTAIELIQPLYISQGLDYCQRMTSAVLNSNATRDPVQRRQYLKTLEQPEQYSLEHLYAPKKKSKPDAGAISAVPLLASFASQLTAMKKTLRDTNETVQALAHQEVEVEREVSVEIETVREIRKPSRAKAVNHNPVHDDLLTFVKTGRIMPVSNAYEQAFIALRRTGVGQRHAISSHAVDSKFFVTWDFMRTVQNDRDQPRDEYLRPVQWILLSAITQAAVVISPHEAEELVQKVRTARSSSVHLVTYAAPTVKSMLIFDTLNFYSVPSLPKHWRAPLWLVRDLGIFAGRLYFDYTHYGSICEAVGQTPPEDAPSANPWDALPFATADVAASKATVGPIAKAPLEFLQQWLSVRRKGQDFSQTPMGYVCAGKEVKNNPVFFTA